MLRTDLSSIESLRSSVQILLYWFLESVLDRGGVKPGKGQISIFYTFAFYVMILRCDSLLRLLLRGSFIEASFSKTSDFDGFLVFIRRDPEGIGDIRDRVMVQSR